ncbi:MAG: hypothetical protein WCI20_12500 [bacterium]
MNKLTIELCPETGICSIIKDNGAKVDLMPDEVEAIRAAGSNAEEIRSVIANCDADFANTLDTQALKQVSTNVA